MLTGVCAGVPLAGGGLAVAGSAAVGVLPPPPQAVRAPRIVTLNKVFLLWSFNKRNYLDMGLLHTIS